MDASNGTNAFPPVLNPEEPFTYLPPDLAHPLHVFNFVTAATTGMFVWELALDMYNIYRMFFKVRPTISSAIYVLSRASTLGFIAFALRFLTQGGNCRRLSIGLTIFWAFASSLTAMLFLLRIWAIFRDQTVITGFFTFLWLCVVAGTVAICLANPPVAHILPNSSFCLLTAGFPPFAGAGIIIPAVFDTLVFFAISFRLFPWREIGSHMTWKERLTFFFRGNSLPRLSKTLLQGGQQYYLLSVAINIFSLVFYFTPSLPPPYHIMVTPILIALINSMACRIYRDIKFRCVQPPCLETLQPNSVFLPPSNGGPHPSLPFCAPRVVVPPEAVTTNNRTSRHTVLTSLTELDIVVITKREHDNFEESENMRAGWN